MSEARSVLAQLGDGGELLDFEGADGRDCGGAFGKPSFGRPAAGPIRWRTLATTVEGVNIASL